MPEAAPPTPPPEPPLFPPPPPSSPPSSPAGAETDAEESFERPRESRGSPLFASLIAKYVTALISVALIFFVVYTIRQDKQSRTVFWVCLALLAVLLVLQIRAIFRIRRRIREGE